MSRTLSHFAEFKQLLFKGGHAMLLFAWRNLGAWLARRSSQRRRRDAGRQSLIRRVGVETLEERSLLSTGLPQPLALAALPAGPVQVLESSVAQNALKGTSTAFHLGSFTDSGTADGPWNVDIIWGDGTPDSTFARTSAGSLGDLTHTFTGTIKTGLGPNGFDPTANFWVTVNVTNQHGDAGTGVFPVAITNAPHVVESSLPQPTLKGKAMTFQLGSFTDSGPTNGPWTVDVNWGDGSPNATFTRTSPGSLGSLAHTYTGINFGPLAGSPGSPVATVRVTNAHGDFGVGLFSVAITNMPQVSEPLPVQNALKGVATTFHLGSFTDSDPTDKPWTVDINWGDGSADSVFTRTATGSLGDLSHTYPTDGPGGTSPLLSGPNGNFWVTVRVTNGHGDFGTSGFGVNLTNVPHVFEPLQGQNTLQGKATVLHLGSFTDSGAADGPWAVDVNWGDNSPDSTFTLTSAGSLGTWAFTHRARAVSIWGQSRSPTGMGMRAPPGCRSRLPTSRTWSSRSIRRMRLRAWRRPSSWGRSPIRTLPTSPGPWMSTGATARPTAFSPGKRPARSAL
jgi:hypothetical protein